MGVVYLAHEESLGRDVALKVLRTQVSEDEGVRARFQREVRAAARVTDDGIVPILSTGEAHGHLWCAMEYVAGSSLDEVLHTSGTGRIHRARAARIAADTAEALDVAHQAGVTHRDVKPGNIILQQRPVTQTERTTSSRRLRQSWTNMPGPVGARVERARLTDFGLAMDITAAKLSVSGMLIGTPGYMAPEQFTGERADVGPATDQWALGVVLYECLTGRLPFPTDDLPSLARFVTTETPVAPSRLDPRVDKDLETICLKALQKHPADRYASCADMAADLRRWLGEHPISARPPGRWRRIRAWGRRHPARATAAIASVAVVLAGLALWLGVRMSERRRIADLEQQARAAMTGERFEEAEALYGEWTLLDSGAATPRDGRERAQALRSAVLAERTLARLVAMIERVERDTLRSEELERRSRHGAQVQGGAGLGTEHARGSEPWWMREPAFRAANERALLQAELAENRARIPTLIAVARSQADAAGDAAGDRGRLVKEQVYTRAAAWHFEQWRRARRAGDREAAVAHRVAVEELAPGAYGDALAGRQTTRIHVPATLVGAKAWLYRYEQEALVVPRGGPRLLPMPADGPDPGRTPEAFTRAVAERLRGEGRRPVAPDVPSLAPPMSDNSLFVGTMGGPMRRTRYAARLAATAYPLTTGNHEPRTITRETIELDNAPGRYLLLLRQPDGRELRVPYEVARLAPSEIRVTLPEAWGVAPAGFAWVSSGPVATRTDSSGEPAPDGALHWTPVSGFWSARLEITYDEYWAFLNDARTLAEIKKHEAEGLRFVPRYEDGAIPPRSGEAGYWAPMDNPEHPAMYLSLYDFVGYPAADRPREEQLALLAERLARSESLGWGYLQWRTERSIERAAHALKTGEVRGDVLVTRDATGAATYHSMRFTLPRAHEWERMARGGDSRRYVYGDEREWLYFKGARSRPQYPQPEPVGLFVDDESVFGVRDLTGSVSEWTADWSSRRGEFRAKGSAWGASLEGLDEIDASQLLAPETVSSTVGFRVIVRTTVPAR